MTFGGCGSDDDLGAFCSGAVDRAETNSRVAAKKTASDQPAPPSPQSAGVTLTLPR